MTNNRFTELTSALKHIAELESINALLGWDEQVNLPSASHAKRSAELSAIARATHSAKTDSAIGRCLCSLELDTKALTDDQRCIIREARKNYDRATKLPADFVAERAETSSKAYHVWTQARAENNFALFAPLLEKQISLTKEEAAYLGYGDAPYDYAIDRHDPGMTDAQIACLFQELRTGLIPLAERILNASVKARTDIFNNFPVEEQKVFLRTVTEYLGFDYTHGRLDVAVHPFCGGSGQDTRMTTRYAVNNPLDSLFSGIHETGHALYEQGLPYAHFGNALGESVGMAIHESQSRLWENQVARSRSFWKFWEPRFRSTFAEPLKSIDSDTLYLAINAVERNLIRVDADEVTYNLHIMLRFELEQQLFSGQLAVRDLPSAWNQLAKDWLGIQPESDATGVLQDVHWSCAAFGYFPSYCLGNMIAAQLWYAVQKELPDLDDDFASGNFSSLLAWLRKNIHAHGKRYNTFELAELASGEKLSAKALLRYLSERYLPLYT